MKTFTRVSHPLRSTLTFLNAENAQNSSLTLDALRLSGPYIWFKDALAT